jgi:DNA invertase Pin-like site-specific DNA recombinase
LKEESLMLIGYARVSTHDQNLDLQKDALEEAGCEKIHVEKASGKSSNRPELEKVMNYLRKGDTLVVWRLDRLGRSMKHLIELVTQMEERGIGFRSLTEAMDTTTSGGKLIFHIFGALAEFERNLIQERTRAGLAAARARGRKGGRPYALDKSKRKMVIDLYNSREHSVEEICQTMGISRPTLYNYLKADKSQ